MNFNLTLSKKYSVSIRKNRTWHTAGQLIFEKDEHFERWKITFKISDTIKVLDASNPHLLKGEDGFFSYLSMGESLFVIQLHFDHEIMDFFDIDMPPFYELND